MKKKIFTLAILLCTFYGILNSTAFADKKNDDAPRGTSAEEVAKLKARPLPHPHDIKVAILPFWDASGSKDNTRMASSAVWLLCQREEFQLTPILDGFKAVDDDGEMEPGLPLRKADAERIGQKLGVDWVIYGEVRELRHYHKRSLFKHAKYVQAALRIAVVEINNNPAKASKIIYWQMRSERRGGTGFFKGRASKGDTLQRKACVTVSYDILKPLFDALPEHSSSDKEIESGDIADFVNATWSKSNKKDN